MVRESSTNDLGLMFLPDRQDLWKPGDVQLHGEDQVLGARVRLQHQLNCPAQGLSLGTQRPGSNVSLESSGGFSYLGQRVHGQVLGARVVRRRQHQVQRKQDFSNSLV